MFVLFYLILLLYCFTALLLYCFTALLLYCFTALLLYCFTALLLYCFTALLLSYSCHEGDCEGEGPRSFGVVGRRRVFPRDERGGGTRTASRHFPRCDAFGR